MLRFPTSFPMYISRGLSWQSPILFHYPVIRDKLFQILVSPSCYTDAVCASKSDDTGVKS